MRIILLLSFYFFQFILQLISKEHTITIPPRLEVLTDVHRTNNGCNSYSVNSVSFFFFNGTPKFFNMKMNKAKPN